MDLIARGLAALDLNISVKGREKLEAFVQEIEKWNPSFGLVAASGDDLIVKHVLDSLAPWKILDELCSECDKNLAAGRASMTDIGSGAGFPGIPLSIIFPDRNFYLVERMGKRVTFLQNEKALLALDNIAIHEDEVEKTGAPLQIAVFRAFRPFSESKLFASIWAKLSPGGAIVAYKGKMANARIELAELGSSRSANTLLAKAATEADIYPLWVPFLEEERCAVIIRKPLG